MNTLNKIMKDFWLEESGMTIVEYAVASTLITAAVILAFSNLGAAVAARINALIAVINP
jgi:pilus assembly protein Flp/PilA